MRDAWLSLSLIMGLVLASVSLVDGAGEVVQMEEWKVRAPGSFPHDPAVAPDESLWYTGMQSNSLGRFDPKTGKIKE